MFFYGLLSDANPVSEAEHTVTALEAFFSRYGGRMAATAAAFAIGYAAIQILAGIMKKILKKSKVDPAIHSILISTVRLICLTLLAITCLGMAGVQMTPLITALGGVALAVALAAKDHIVNILGGLTVLVSKPFVQGDHIEINEISGVVKSIGWFYTVLITFDNKNISIPNSQITNAHITNYSTEPLRRLDLMFPIGYDEDFEKVKALLLEQAQASGLLSGQREHVVQITGYGDSFVQVTVRLWVENKDYWTLQFYMLEHVKTTFKKAGIQVPFQKLDVLVRNDGGSEYTP